MTLNKLHRGLSLVIGIQLLIWIVTGLYFNLMNSSLASGNELRQAIVHIGEIKDFDLKPVNSLHAKPNLRATESQVRSNRGSSLNAPTSIQLIWILQKPYYLAQYDAVNHAYQLQNSVLLNAVSGNVAEIDARLAKAIALRSYKPPFTLFESDTDSVNTQVQDTLLLQPPIAELPNERNSVWKIQLKDVNNTNIYVSSVNGSIIAHINDDRRLRNFMFKLHFMDYANEGHFNHWLIIIFAIGAVLMSITGFAWLITLFRMGRFKIRHRRFK